MQASASGRAAFVNFGQALILAALSFRGAGAVLNNSADGDETYVGMREVGLGLFKRLGALQLQFHVAQFRPVLDRVWGWKTPTFC